MARIPQEEIDRVKREVPLAELVRVKGIVLKPHGANLLGLCPFHDDHEPSLVVTPSKNLWHCLGACQAGGDVFAWVMRAEGIESFRHAYEILTTGFYAPEAKGKVVRDSSVPKLASPISLEMTNAELMLRVVEYYAETASKSPELLAYLEKRAINYPEVITRFKLGFANRTLGLRLPAKNRQEGEELRTRLQSLGILRDTGHEHFNGSLVVPVFDTEGNVTEMYGRKITERLRAGTPLHLYLPGPHSGVWNREGLTTSKDVILCESLIDALSFWCHGFSNVTAAYGIEGFTSEHLEAFEAAAIERVLIAYDHDDAGNRAAAKLAPKLQAAGFDVYRIELPKGMDVNEYVQKMSPAEKALGLLVKSAAWMGKGAGIGEEGARIEDRGAREAIEPEPNEKQAALPLAAEIDEKQATKEETAPPESSLAPSSEIQAPASTWRGDELVFTFGDRAYAIRGVKKLTTFDSMKIGVLLTRESVGAAHLDSFDLAVARQRAQFEKLAAGEIGVKEEVVHRDVGRILLELESVRRRQIEEASAPKEKPVTISETDREKALALLKDPNLVSRILGDIGRCGLVGEETNKLMAYLAATSRKLDEPLAIIIQSSSAAGKTTLMDAVLRMMPDEEQERYSAVTGKALFYISEETSLRHKILAISEEEGAEHATYALKLLQSEGKLSIASTGKDPVSGKLVTQEYHVEGPVMIILTTTAIEIDEELLNRCVVLTVDEDRAQTRAIHQLQREAQTIEGLIAKRESAEIRTLHQNAQRLLRPLLVSNPHARSLTFIDARTRTRRDHMKYLTLIRTIALLHQYQRPRKTRVLPGGEVLEYIEATREDVRLANELAHEVLGRSLDELAPQTRKLLGLLDEMVARESKRLHIDRTEFHFTKKDVRDFTGWSEVQVKRHMYRLLELEYLLVHRGGRGNTIVYELLYQGEGKGRQSFMIGLLDADQLPAYDARLDPPKRGLDPPRTPQRPPMDGPRTIAPIPPIASPVSTLGQTTVETTPKPPLGDPSGAVVVPDDELPALAFPKPGKKPKPGNGRDREAPPSFSRLRRVPRAE
jgi:DNA primase catalytic core